MLPISPHSKGCINLSKIVCVEGCWGGGVAESVYIIINAYLNINWEHNTPLPPKNFRLYYPYWQYTNLFSIFICYGTACSSLNTYRQINFSTIPKEQSPNILKIILTRIDSFLFAWVNIIKYNLNSLFHLI